MPDPATARPTPRSHDPLAKFPENVRQAYQDYQTTRNARALHVVVLAVVRDHVPKHLAPPPDQPLPENAALMNDLGFDSLAIAELVFFLEELLKVKITNAEIIGVRTVGELRAFVELKLGSPAATSGAARRS